MYPPALEGLVQVLNAGGQLFHGRKKGSIASICLHWSYEPLGAKCVGEEEWSMGGENRAVSALDALCGNLL